MGVYYSQYLIPTSALGRYRPSIDTVVALVRRLEIHRWIETHWKKVLIAGPEHTTKTLSEAFAEDLSVFFDLGGPMFIGPFLCPDPSIFWGEETVRSDGRWKAYDFDEDPAAILRPQYVNEISLTITQTPHLVPDGYSDNREAPCPSCGTDFLRARPSKNEDLDLSLWNFRAGLDLYWADPCRTCGQSCPTDISAALPLFTFGLRVSPPAKSRPPHSHGFADPSLLADLEEITGVPFKMVPSWS